MSVPGGDSLQVSSSSSAKSGNSAGSGNSTGNVQVGAATFNANPKASSGVSTWVWYVVGGIIIIVGAAWFLKRRKA